MLIYLSDNFQFIIFISYSWFTIMALYNKIKRAVHKKNKIFKSYLSVIIETFRMILKLFFETG